MRLLLIGLGVLCFRAKPTRYKLTTSAKAPDTRPATSQAEPDPADNLRNGCLPIAIFGGTAAIGILSVLVVIIVVVGIVLSAVGLYFLSTCPSGSLSR